ncbi:sigma-70 family RNA polymerase sigma factor [Rhizobium sp. CG5]|uniref:sigma-70 family RNA polymerase sigma factor n=1 Tax=Rhizobium sp. CG5 TaxID=2726076 RepID=UPI002034523B|nr:sigma-70 family RNA polymerase sigma factor [Rhizobium sp. CG5]MCM2475370.1 sigma-70 family RNA polymerase sigma factor [Rhizobium sp. CG5]
MDPDRRNFDIIGQLASLRRYARSLVRDPGDAEDLVHDALVKAYERRLTFKAGANLRGWLLSIVHNTYVDARRSHAARKRRDDALQVEGEPLQPASQEDALHLAQIREAFLSLPLEQREALHLVAIEDMSYQAAADTLGIPVGTLMSRVSRARAKLRTYEDDAGARSHLKLVGGGND